MLFGSPQDELPESAQGQQQKCPGSRGTSVLPSGADIASTPRQVRFVPRSDINAPNLFDLSDLSHNNSMLVDLGCLVRRDAYKPGECGISIQ
jgi:hypothetical protein